MSHRRRVAAGVLAPVVATAVVCGSIAIDVTVGQSGAIAIDASPSIFAVGMVFGLPIAVFHFLCIGLPLYLWLRRGWVLTWWMSALSGSLAAIMPISLIGLLQLVGDWIAERPLIERIEQGAPALAVLGLAGGVAGLTFWAVGHAGSHTRRDYDGLEIVA